MRIKISEEVKESIMNHGVHQKVVKHKKNKMYLRYDSMTVTSTEVFYSYKGMKVFSLPHHAMFHLGDCLTIDGVEGAHRFKCINP